MKFACIFSVLKINAILILKSWQIFLLANIRILSEDHP